MVRHVLRLLLLTGAVVLVQGCSKPWVRPYEWSDQQAALQTLAARTESVKSVQAACGLTLSDASGQSVNFDGAIVVRTDEQEKVWVRLRAWKFSQAVFDVTIRPDGTWLLASDELLERQSEGLAAVSHHDLAAAWMIMMGRFFNDPGTKVIDDGGAQFVVEQLNEATGLRAIIDRATLTVSEYQFLVSGKPVQTLTLSQYREIGADATPWPMKIRATSDEGFVEVRLEDVELNGLMDEAAFTPPRRAVKQDEPRRDRSKRESDES